MPSDREAYLSDFKEVLEENARPFPIRVESNSEILAQHR
jgi:hypothetical protein